VDVPEAAVEAFEPVGAKSITWNNDTDPSNMNDFVVAGVYDIKGERKRTNDNLPILNTGGGHSFNARLTVLDSSITGSGMDDDKCITQVLSFSNRLGQGEVYIRTGKGSSLDNLTWEKWSTLQRNVNVGEVKTLDNLIDNGIYSGAYIGTGNKFTFVMVVINDYAPAAKLGADRVVNQFLYAVEVGGVVRYTTRQKIGGAPWKSEEILNKDEITSMISAEIKKVNDRISTLIDGAPEAFDTLKEIADWIANDETGAVALANAIKTESQRAQTMEQQLQEWMDADKQESQAADDDIRANAMQYNTLGVATHADKAEIYGRSINTDVRVVEFPAATTEKAGVMTAEDKEKLEILQLNNMECASRASIKYDLKTKTLTIGTGNMYFYNGKGKQIFFNNTLTYTYTFTGSRVIVFDTVNSAITDKSPEGTLATDIWLLWYDNNAIKGGILYNYVNNSDLTKKIRYNNMEVVSRAAVSYNSSTKTISIGSGKIFCYNSNTRVEINLTTPYEYTFTGSATIVYNTVDKTIIKRDPVAVNDYDVVLLWYDGTKGLHAGLLYKYVKEEADNVKEQNPPLNKKISAGTVILDNLVVGVPVYIQVRLTGTNCGIGVYDADGNRKKILKNRTDGKAGEVESVLYVIEDGDAKIKEVGWSSLYLDYALYLDASSYTAREGVVNQEKYINTQIAASLDTPIKSIMHGGTGSYPQNNLVLYKNAAQKGMLFWECDVRPCADGYVLSHDDDMYQLALDADGNQLTQDAWLCSQKTVAELKTLRTGIKKGVYSIVKGYENATVATLEEFIVLAKVYGACPVIEIKFTATEAQIREIYSIVKRHGMVGRSLFLLYGNRALHGQYFHAIDENANLVFCGEGSIAASDLDAIISYKNDRNVMGLSYFIAAYTDEVLNKALNAGLLIGTWSATSSSNIVSLVNKGYSMFTIDDMAKNSVTTLRSLV
jgi:hypothetical protein